ncbi:hypothetical protein GM547_04195 [Streptococcus pneumoniae]|nr:hypothetical protein [Streptococcus pneumoniae]MTW29418.1 hypothetical protein [Streptococcus pneumoniae]
MSLFIIGHMGLFFYNKIGSIISIGDLPTTNIIEPKKEAYTSFLVSDKSINFFNKLSNFFYNLSNQSISHKKHSHFIRYFYNRTIR